MKPCLSILFILLTWEASFAFAIPTDTTRTFYLGSSVQVGNVVGNRTNANPIAERVPWMLELDFSFLKATQTAYDYCGCYTKSGVSYTYTDFANPTQLGSGHSLGLFTEPYLLNKKNVQLSLRGGAGLIYLNKIYDEQTNPENLLFSNHVSFRVTLGSQLYFNVSPALQLNLNAQFNHISNGGSQYPNYGMNMLTTGLGLDYRLNNNTPRERKPLQVEWDRSWKIITHVFAGPHTADSYRGFPERNKLVTGLNTGLVKPLSRVNALGAGGEVYYDALAQLHESQTGWNFHSWHASVSAQHYIFLGRLLLGQQLAYFVTPLNRDQKTRVYQRYYIEYKFKESWYAGLSLKTHGTMSDYLGISLGKVIGLGK
ncbi:MAG: acyloxyacyl hydrolase [Cyclobacteriaceae bacterium]